MSKLLIRSIFTIILLMGLSACGGGGGFSGDSDSGGSGDDGGGGDTGETETPTIKIGVYTGHSFTEGTLDIEDTSISAISSTTVTVNFVYEDNTPITDGIDRVTFSSACAETDPATATITSPVTISSGVATATYTPEGCSGTDTITAQASYDGETLSATGTITVSPIRIGLLAGSAFTAGTLKIEDSIISAIDSTTATAYLVDQDGQLITSGISYVTFSSTCVEAETASIITPATVSSGVASTTYTAEGCAGADTITAEATYFGQTITATGAITVGTVRMGSFISGTFTAETLKITVNSISSGGTTDVTVNLVDENDEAITDDIINQVTFNSPCISEGTASITSPVTVSSGIATTNYVASNCEGDDIITARATLNGSTLSATGTVTVAPQSAGSIAFISATPDSISVQGAGGAGRSETSSVKFQALNADGDPIEGETITFTTNHSLGGLSINPSSVDSDSEGYVETTVSSGAIPTPVSVIATVASNTTLSTQSTGLVISTGLPDQDSMSMSLTKHNVEGWDTNGEEVTVSVWLSDNTNNPVPDGTAVTFMTEGGQIETSCETSEGSCSVTWTSSNPRPADGRITILAFADGQESFTDLNSTGRFDEYQASTLEPFTDMPEAWLDINENDAYDVDSEPYRDSGIINGVYDAADGVFNGYLCNDASCTSATKSIHVRKSQVLVMSGEDAIITPTAISSLVALGTVDDVNDCILLNSSNDSVDITFNVADIHDQQMPVGTTVAVSSTQGTAELVSGTTPWPDSNDGSTKREYQASLEWDEAAGEGDFSITVTTPKGIESKYTRCVIEE